VEERKKEKGDKKEKDAKKKKELTDKEDKVLRLCVAVGCSKL